MKLSMKALFVVFIFLSILVFSDSSYAWWTKTRPGQKPIHFLLILISSEKLIHNSLYKEEALFNGSNDADRRPSLTHDRPFRVKQAMCAAVGEFFDSDIKKDWREWEIRRLGRSFHYLADQADPTDFLPNKDAKDAMRRYAYDLLIDKFSEIKIGMVFNDNVQSYVKNIRGFTFDQMIHYARSQAKEIAKDLNKPSMKDACLAKAFALIRVCQDRLIDFFLSERANDASGICKHEQAYCKGLEKKIRQACRRRDINTVTSLLKDAKKAEQCVELRNKEKHYRQSCASSVQSQSQPPQQTRPPAPTASPPCQKVCVEEQVVWLNVTDGRHSLCAGGVARPPGPGLPPPKCERSVRCLKWETRCP